MRSLILFVAANLILSTANAQAIALGTTNPDPSSVFDIYSTNGGLLPPRMTIAQRDAIASPAKGLVVFVITDSSFYYFDGLWKRLAPANEIWGLKGNSSTIDGTSFIGTIDNVPLTFKVNNQLSGRIDHILFNSFWGYQSGSNNSTGSNNTANGFNALYSNTIGNSNTALGGNAQYSNIKGSTNTSIGANALYTNTGGFQNTAIGANALYYTTGDCCFNPFGYANTAVGAYALYSNNQANSNTAVGVSALHNSYNGRNNTAVGASALSSNVNGSFNTAIGVNANVSIDNLNTSTAIGSNAIVNADYKIRLGSSAVTAVEGAAAYTVSDGRFKQDVNDNVPGLDLILSLRPVTYRYKSYEFDRFLMQNNSDQLAKLKQSEYVEAEKMIHMGFIAQEAEQVLQKKGYQLSFVRTPTNPTDNWSIAYGELLAPLVKGMQEQQQTINDQNSKIDNLQKQIDELKKLIRQGH